MDTATQHHPALVLLVIALTLLELVLAAVLALMYATRTYRETGAALELELAAEELAA